MNPPNDPRPLSVTVPVGVTWAVAGIAFMSFVGAWQLYRGTSIKVLIPAYFTFAIFGLAILNLLVQGRISFSPTQIVPLVVGVMAIVAHILVHRKSSMDWTRSQAVVR